MIMCYFSSWHLFFSLFIILVYLCISSTMKYFELGNLQSLVVLYCALKWWWWPKKSHVCLRVSFRRKNHIITGRCNFLIKKCTVMCCAALYVKCRLLTLKVFARRDIFSCSQVICYKDNPALPDDACNLHSSSSSHSPFRRGEFPWKLLVSRLNWLI